VESVEQRDGGATVYNFEVAQNHNYFVGEVGTLVHNDCNNIKGAAFENLIVSKLAREVNHSFFRPVRRGGIDVVSLENGVVVLNEAKFANRLQFDDFTAITSNLRGNVQEVLDSLPGSANLSRTEKTLVRGTLTEFLNGGLPANLRVRVITGKSAVGVRLQRRLQRTLGELPIEFRRFRE
jgi:hypothetical protein